MSNSILNSIIINSNVDFDAKYKKYKMKYLQLKSLGGAEGKPKECKLCKNDMELLTGDCEISCDSAGKKEVDKKQMILEKYPQERIINIDTESVDLKNTQQANMYTFKPKGIWYGFGTSWIDWATTIFPDDIGKYYFKLEVDTSKILKISNIEEAVTFNKKYGISSDIKMETGDLELLQDLSNKGKINWGEVSKDYAGFELNPYLYDLRADSNFTWLYVLDVASGVIWDSSAIISVKKI
ncbi:hypothetical protein CPAV1605_1140 [seawater metagenome]|uniref:Uncharacterized protein n=1 Tax=seawater metagenome TaxID=1561972 RepID=A0A5E8CKW6_9ZZZZ